MDELIAQRLEVALRIADDAEGVVMDRYQAGDLKVEIKPDGSPVSEGDLASHDVIARAVERAFPHDAILSEEAPLRSGTSGFRWVVDPIDGTSSYVRGVPLFAILIGIEHEGVPVAGVACLPALCERVWASRESGAHWRRGDGSVVEARVSSVEDLGGAMVEAASPTAFLSRDLEREYLSLAGHAKKLRGWSEGAAFAFVATGRVDAGVSVGMSRWDVAAYVPIVEGAGGRLTRWDGGAAVDGRRMIASNGLIHVALQALLNPAGRND
jgi:histidinol-phosphatase